MPRNRFSQALLLIAGLVAVTYLMISLYLPSSRWLIFGIDKRSGQVRMAEQRVTFLPPYRFFRLKFEKREGYAQRDGLIRAGQFRTPAAWSTRDGTRGFARA